MDDCTLLLVVVVSGELTVTCASAEPSRWPAPHCPGVGVFPAATMILSVHCRQNLR